ncbi:proliferating cell nuclear antigen (pcna) [Candidatus Micrarchaeota archaeon]|jgi:proliferating cell nuclear antigen|nr:proliferating cell nuclear antigen (pcna) [Candidatus Micrarchaeota archaeon]
MFKIVMQNAKSLKNIIDAVVNLIDEGPLEIKKDGLFLRAIDPSQIAMITLNVPKEAFVEYTVDSPTTLGLNFVNLDKILARARPKENLTLNLDENTLIIEFSSEKSKRTFKIPLLETKDMVQKELNIDADAEIKMLSGSIKESLKDAGLVSSYLALEVNGETLTFDVKGDSGKLRIENQKDGNIIREVKADKKARASFSLQYLENIIKACPDANIINLFLKSDMPIKVKYNIEDADLTYYLAPRKEED